jgi:hypothetical protein
MNMTEPTKGHGRGRNHYHPFCSDAQQAIDEAGAMQRIKRMLEHYMDGGPDYGIVSRAIAFSVGMPLAPIDTMWAEVRAYVRDRDAKRAAEAEATNGEGTAA